MLRRRCRSPSVICMSRTLGFAATYEKIQPGLARFVRDAIRINAGMPPAED